MKKVLAFDFGASSGRAIIGEYENGKIKLTEVHRFDNEPVMVNGNFQWDVLRLFHEIKQGILKAKEYGFESIGIDTWGVDFGLLAKDGRLLENPFNYRDLRTEGMIEAVDEIIPRDELYKSCGIQIAVFNTVYQLMSLLKNRPDMLEHADTFLLMPDLFNYFLTGEKACEISIASTSQLLEPYTKEWNTELIKKLGLDVLEYPKLVKSGTVVGDLDKAICEEFNMETKKVIAVASHDTASAVAAVPSSEKDFVFISCGTWSLFGTELDAPVISEEAKKYNVTNEVGYNNTTRFLKNIIGLWFIQETRRQFKREGKNYSYAEMEALARECESFKCFVDPDYDEFLAPGNMPQKIKDYCKRTGQYVPQTDGEVIRCIYESLAMKYKMVFEQLKECTGKDFPVIHMIGGGTKDNFLCQMASDATNTPVIAGPIEGTAVGNVIVQLISLGEIKDIGEARKLVADSFDVVKYQPAEHEKWQNAYADFLKAVNN